MYYSLVLQLNFPKIIHAHIPGHILPSWLLTAVLLTRCDTEPPQLALLAVVDVVHASW